MNPLNLSRTREISRDRLHVKPSEESRCLLKNVRHLKRVNGALIVFDLTDSQSFENVSFHLKLMRQYSEPDTVVFLVGNKLDLNDNRKVTKNAAEEFSRKNGLEYEEVSAQENQNVKECFDKLIESNEFRRNKNSYVIAI